MVDDRATSWGHVWTCWRNQMQWDNWIMVEASMGKWALGEWHSIMLWILWGRENWKMFHTSYYLKNQSSPSSWTEKWLTLLILNHFRKHESIYQFFFRFLNAYQGVILKKIFFMSDKALLTIHSKSHGCEWPRAMIWAKAVLKIRTICHARDLWKLAQSCKQLHLLCLP